MWLYLIISLYNGITGHALSFYYPYFNNNTFHSVVLKDDLFYNTIFRPDTISGEWTISDTALITKVPILAASSLKQKDSASFISIDFITPVFDTFNRVFLSLNANNKETSYKALSAIGYVRGIHNKRVLTLFFKTTDKSYANFTTLRMKQFNMKSETLWKNKLRFSKNDFIFKSGIFKIGLFHWNMHDTYYGITSGIKNTYVSFNMHLPINVQKPFYTLLVKAPPLYISLKKDLKYALQSENSLLEKREIVGIRTKHLSANLWGIEAPDTLYGFSFMTHLSTLISGGFNAISTKNAHHASMILCSSHSFYNNELQYTLRIHFHDMRYIYYSVEILLFKNLVIRKFKLENGDFIGIFIRLVN